MYNSADGGAYALLAVFGLFLWLIAIALYVLSSWFMMKIFDKAGVQGRWRAWVPVYNTMVFSKLGDLNPWLILIAWGASVLLAWLPLIGWIFSILPLIVTALAAWRVGLKLQKEAVWVILYVFLFLVWLGILAFDKSRWNPAIPPAPWAGNNFLADRTQWAGIPNQAAAGGYAAPGAYPPPAAGAYPPPAPGAYPPPAGYSAPPAGYTPPPAAAAEPPAYTPPAASEPPAYAPPAASEPPAGYTPPPAASAAAEPAAAKEPAGAPEPAAAPESPAAPAAPEAPAASEPAVSFGSAPAPEAPAASEPAVAFEPAPAAEPAFGAEPAEPSPAEPTASEPTAAEPTEPEDPDTRRV